MCIICVCVCVCACVCVYACVYVYVCNPTCMCVGVCVYVCKQMCMIDLYALKKNCMKTETNTTRVQLSHTSIHAHTHTYTRTHTHKAHTHEIKLHSNSKNQSDTHRHQTCPMWPLVFQARKRRAVSDAVSDGPSSPWWWHIRATSFREHPTTGAGMVRKGLFVWHISRPTILRHCPAFLEQLRTLER